MAQLIDFSSAQIEEAEKWYKENQPKVFQLAYDMNAEYPNDSKTLLAGLYDTFFSLKILSIELRPNQFIIGVDYKSLGSVEKDREEALLGNVQFNLSFWNPHPKDIADTLAKDFLIAKLSTL